jgi:glucose/arabinose dehydrogenase
MLAACQTADENNNSASEPTTAPSEPAAAPTDPQPAATTLPDPVEPAEPDGEPFASPTTPPELVGTEAPPESAAQPATAVQLVPIAGGFERPTFLTHAGDGRLFVSEQAGRISLIENGQVLPALFLDIEDRVGSQSLEQGLLSFVFHPDYAQNGRFFVNYTNQEGDTVVSRFQVNGADPNTADPASEQKLLVFNQPL